MCQSTDQSILQSINHPSINHRTLLCIDHRDAPGFFAHLSSSSRYHNQPAIHHGLTPQRETPAPLLLSLSPLSRSPSLFLCLAFSVTSLNNVADENALLGSNSSSPSPLRSPCVGRYLSSLFFHCQPMTGPLSGRDGCAHGAS